MQLVSTLDAWFEQQLNDLDVEASTRAYIVNLLARTDVKDNLHRESVVLLFAQARAKSNFDSYRRVGDWSMWTHIVCPELINDEHELLQTLGRLSYYACHRMLRGEWRLYEELADSMVDIVDDVRSRLGIVLRTQYNQSAMILPRIV